MARTPEGIEKDKVKKFLTYVGAYQHWPVPGGFGRQSVDCFACIKGQFWAIEVKAHAQAKPTARQQQTLNEVRAAKGGICAGTGSEIVGYLCNCLGVAIEDVLPPQS